MRVISAVLVWLALCLAARGAAPSGPQGLPEAILRELKPGGRLPAAKYTLVKTWQAEAAGHNTGHLVADPDADGGKAWEVKAGADAAGAFLFGPYIRVQPGDYVAFCRIKLMDSMGEGIVATLDACVSAGQRMLAWKQLFANALEPGQYVQIPIGFQYKSGRLECRIMWSSDAALRVDTVSLFRVQGSAALSLTRRAAAAKPSGEPSHLPLPAEPRPFPDIFPRSALPAQELLVCDLRKERRSVRLLAYCLQGLINRKQPRVYCLSTDLDAFWLQHMLRRGWVKRTQSVKPLDLLKRFASDYRGAVVFDPALPASKNVATMIAGVRGALVASPSLAKELSLKVVDDLRGRWKTSADAYAWAFEHLWPQLSHHVIACAWPEHLALRDYLVQHKVFIFWISGPLDGSAPYASPTREARLMEKLLAKMPVNIPVMSYPWAAKDIGVGEGPGVSLFAEFGKYLVGSINCSNLSVHSGVRVREVRQRPAPPAPALKKDKVYFSFILSDGDNLPVLMRHNFPQLWRDKLRGRFPIGWTLSPAARVLIPDIVDYYYGSATANDYFLGAVSGVGYTYPDLYGKRYRDRRRVYDGFLDQTADYMKRSDLRELWVMNATRPDILSRYAERIPFLRALFPDYGRRIGLNEEPTYPTARNVPVFRAVGRWRQDASRAERLKEVVADVRRMTPAERPAFLHVFVLNWFADLPMLQQIAKELGPDYVAVRPDHLAALWRQAMRDAVVLIRTPRTAPAIQGVQTVISGRLRNVSGAAQVVRLSVASGFEADSIAPARVELGPAKGAEFTLVGRPTAGVIKLRATGAFGVREKRIKLMFVERGEVLGGLPAGQRLVPAKYLEAETLSHSSGQTEPDAQAKNGQAWVVRKPLSRPGHVLFGPYAELPKGKYLALFRVKRLGDGQGAAAVLDACVGGGKPQTGEKRVAVKDLPLGRYVCVPLIFDHPGGKFETRVMWPGACPLAIDSIAVWRME